MLADVNRMGKFGEFIGKPKEAGSRSEDIRKTEQTNRIVYRLKIKTAKTVFDEMPALFQAFEKPGSKMNPITSAVDRR